MNDTEIKDAEDNARLAKAIWGEDSEEYKGFTERVDELRQYYEHRD
jgi:hypothetical protein